MAITHESVGDLVRRWRERRRRSQLDVSIAADVSARHLSFIETGSAKPSTEMIERLCDELEVPLRERNEFYLAAGFAPAYRERPLADLGVARSAVEAVLAGHEPNPAMAINVRWELLAANPPMEVFLQTVPATLLEEPVNVLRAMLHPQGMARQVRNYGQWRAGMTRRVRRQLERTGAVGLAELLAEVEAYPAPDGQVSSPAANDLVLPTVLATDYGDLSLHHALTVFGAARDVTLDEIAIETFFPADPESAHILRLLAAAHAPTAD